MHQMYYLLFEQGECMTNSAKEKKCVFGTRWESIVGYSRVCRVWRFCIRLGTTATDKEGSIIGIGNPYLQNIQIIKNIQIALQMVGGYLKDVVRTRIYITDINNWEKVGQAHSEYFEQIKSADTLIKW